MLRDFTINSLFYNLNEQKVEDLTGKGKDDLRAGIMRTPLPPTETFLDGEHDTSTCDGTCMFSYTVAKPCTTC